MISPVKNTEVTRILVEGACAFCGRIVNQCWLACVQTGIVTCMYVQYYTILVHECIGYLKTERNSVNCMRYGHTLVVGIYWYTVWSACAQQYSTNHRMPQCTAMYKVVKPIRLNAVVCEELHRVLLQHQVPGCQDNRPKVPVVGELGVAVLLSFILQKGVRSGTLMLCKVDHESQGLSL